jgi:hypothetical protein
LVWLHDIHILGHFYDAVYTLLLLFWMIYEMCSYDTGLSISYIDKNRHVDIMMIVYSVGSWRDSFGLLDDPVVLVLRSSIRPDAGGGPINGPSLHLLNRPSLSPLISINPIDPFSDP